MRPPLLNQLVPLPLSLSRLLQAERRGADRSSLGSPPSTPSERLAISKSNAPAPDITSKTDASPTMAHATKAADPFPSSSSTSLVWSLERIRAVAWGTSSWMTCAMQMR